MRPGETIAFFTRYLPNMGGIEFFTDNLASQLVRDGYEPIVITTDSAQTELARDFTIVRLPSKNLLSGRYPIPLHSTVRTQLKTLLLDRKVHHVVINGRFYPLSRLGAKLARELNTTPLVIDHSSSYVANPKTGMGACLAIADHITTALLKFYDPSFYCVSKRSSEWLKRFNITSSGEIHNALDASQFRAQAHAIPLPSIQTDRNKSFRVAFAGRLIQEKGILNLIDAFAKLNPGPELYIAGSGPLHDTVSLLANENSSIHYLGRLDHPSLSFLLQQCDVFCFPTEYGEGLPTCLLEAGACGCALITTDTGGTAEIIPTKDHGIVLKNTDPSTIADAINQLLMDHTRVEILRTNAQNHIESTFTWKNTEHELLEALEAVRR